MTPHLHIQLLGEFRLSVDEHPLDTLYQPRLQALMAYLLLHRHAPQPRQQIAFSFWPDSSEQQAYTNLRKLFFQLRRVLPQADAFLTVERHHLGWRPDAAFTLDVAEVEEALGRLAQGASTDVAAVERLVELYRGELLPTCYDDWLLPLRRSLHEQVVNALAQGLGGLEAQRQYQVGLRTAQFLVRLDPLYEAAYRHLMSMRALSGDRAGALRVYHECVTVLAQDLGVSPATETQLLYQQLRTAEPQAGPAPTTGQEREHIPLVGRKLEWPLLQQAWHQTASRRPHLVTVWGEAGVGKTRLVEELLRWARLRPGTVAYARAYAAETTLAYAPLAAWLRSEGMGEGIRRLEPVWQTELARLLPALLAENPDLSPPAAMGEDWQRHRFHEALARAVRAGPAPRLLVLDDLQWCDGETLSWLHYLLRSDEQAPLLVVGTVRTEAVDEMHPLHTLRLALQRAGQWSELTLAPLSRAETALLAGHLSKADATPWTAQLYAETEGNPLFVVEMIQAGFLAHLPDAQAKPAVALPPTVQAVITTRLGQISPPARQLAQVAAVIGRAFAVAVLAAASDLPEDALVEGVDELWRRRIVREQGDGYDFSHDKIREVAYAQVPPLRRQRLHRRVAQALEQHHAHQLAEVAGSLAAHYEQAADNTKAVAYLEMAGQHAAARFAHDEALGYLARALALTPETERAQRFRLLCSRAAIYRTSGQLQRYHEDLPALQVLAVALDEAQGTVRHQAAVETQRAACFQHLGQYDDAVRAAQQATALAQQSDDVALAALGYGEWGLALWTQGQMEPAHRCFAQSLAQSRRLGNRRLEARALEYLSQTGMFSSAPEAEIWGYLEQCLAIHQETQDLAGEASIYNKLGYVTVAQDKSTLGTARDYYSEGLRICRQIGERALEATLLGNLGVLYTLQGDYRHARLHLDQARQICKALKKVRGEGVVHSYLGYACMQRGDYGAALRHLQAALGRLKPIGSLQWLTRAHNDLGLLYLEMGELGRAREQVRQAVEVACALGDRRQEAAAATSLGHIHAACGEIDEAAAAYEHAVAEHQQLSQYSRSLEPLAGLAHLAAQRHDLVVARQVVEQILDHVGRKELDRTDAALRIYMSCYHILRTVDDPRADGLLDCAYEQLQARSQSLDTDEERRLFWAAPAHQAVQTAHLDRARG